MVVIIALGLSALAGCASGEDSADPSSTSTTAPGASASASGPPSPSSSEEASATDADDAVEVSVSLRDGKVSPPPQRVKVPQGADVRLTVTLDVDDVVHVHGSDIEEPVEAGRPTTIELVASDQGVFEVETHDGGITLLQLEVR